MSDVIAEYQAYKSSCGLFQQPKGVIKVSGPQASDFLHRLTTQNIKSMTPGTGLPAALLQSNAMVVSMFELYHTGNFFLLVTDSSQTQATYEYLEKLHFTEDLQIETVTDQFTFLSVQGPHSRDVVQKALGRVPAARGEIIGAHEAFISYSSDFEGQGYHLLIKREFTDEVFARLRKAGGNFLSEEFRNLLRLESGRFQFGVDINEKNLILEASSADSVSRNKGCYPGQEVVERVFTYGNVAKKLVGLQFGADAPVAKPQAKVFADDKEIGHVTSSARLPWNNQVVALAIVRRPHYEEGSRVLVEGVAEPAEVISLPQSFEIETDKTEKLI